MPDIRGHCFSDVGASVAFHQDDVVGMTKGKIATYGVVERILQQNLGSLAHLWLFLAELAFWHLNPKP